MSQERFNEETNVVCVTVRNGRFLILVGAEEKKNAYQVQTILSLQQSELKPSVLDIVAVYDFIGYVSGPHHIPFEAIDAFHTLDSDFKFDLIRFANAKDVIDRGIAEQKKEAYNKTASLVTEEFLGDAEGESEDLIEGASESAKIIKFNRKT